MNMHTDPAIASSARRRLVRGVFSAPAVLALHSGSALAASSNLRCVQNQAASMDPVGAVDGVDQYVRVQLHVQKDASDNILAYYLSGSLVDNVRFGYRKVIIAPALPGVDQWKLVTVADNGGVALGQDVVLSQPPSTSPASKWVALRFAPRKTGGYVDVVGIIDGTGDGSAVTGSCWSSFVGLTGV
jgi:hypothetical protein